MVFVGYGVVAPEYRWDDFKDVDVKGKIIVVLINDPPVPDPHDPSKLDENTFKGKAMTYYGRWTYKFEEAAAKGALGCLIVHQTGPAGYPWGVVTTATPVNSSAWSLRTRVRRGAPLRAGSLTKRRRSCLPWRVRISMPWRSLPPAAIFAQSTCE